MGPKHTKDDLLVGALACATAEGLSQLTFGRVAKQLGISDRTVVYYFPTKDDLISEVLLAMGVELQSAVGAAFSQPAEDHLAMARTAWPLLCAPEAEPTFSLFFEANGLAAAGREPYCTVIPQLIQGWIVWAAELTEGTEAERLIEAEAAIALIDGLLLMRLLAGPAAAERAAVRLGVA